MARILNFRARSRIRGSKQDNEILFFVNGKLRYYNDIAKEKIEKS